MPRPAADLAERRVLLINAARSVAEDEGWPAVTIRRLASELGVSQPVVYSAFDGRQALIDAVALDGFSRLAERLSAAAPTPEARMAAYLGFAAASPRLYEAMFLMPSGLAFAQDTTPAPMRAAFRGIAGAFDITDPGALETQGEVAWAVWHGLATLTAARRLRPAAASDRTELAAHLIHAATHQS